MDRREKFVNTVLTLAPRIASSWLEITSSSTPRNRRLIIQEYRTIFFQLGIHPNPQLGWGKMQFVTSHISFFQGKQFHHIRKSDNNGNIRTTRNLKKGYRGFVTGPCWIRIIQENLETPNLMKFNGNSSADTVAKARTLRRKRHFRSINSILNSSWPNGMVFFLWIAERSPQDQCSVLMTRQLC